MMGNDGNQAAGVVAAGGGAGEGVGGERVLVLDGDAPAAGAD